jgi:phosphoserine aminotransferase
VQNLNEPAVADNDGFASNHNRDLWRLSPRAGVPAALPSPNRFNFSGGPGALPEPVLLEVEQAVREVPGQGLSILGISHRSRWFRGVLDEAEANIRTLLKVSDDYEILFLQGGGTLQFSMIPMTLLAGDQPAASYLHTGYWSGMAIAEARREGPVNVAWSGAREGFRRLPADHEIPLSKDATYFHYVSNETVEGLQFHRPLAPGSKLRVCDMSSDFLSRPHDVDQFGIIYAHAQKNLGPAGVTAVLIRNDIVDRVPTGLPSMLDYREHARMGSIYNTPPVFAIYVTMLVTRWLLDEIGGLDAMGSINRRKAATLYQYIDQSRGFYRPRVTGVDRSLMNVTFRLATPALEAEFVELAESHCLYGLGGHRTVGGIRASLYNAVSQEAVETLCEFMSWFQNTHQDEVLASEAASAS